MLDNELKSSKTILDKTYFENKIMLCHYEYVLVRP
jgi:hypothetical protein